MIKQVKIGGKGGTGGGGGVVTETLKHFFVFKIPEILIGLKVYNYSPLLLNKYDLYVTSS